MLQQTTDLILSQWHKLNSDPGFSIETFVRNFSRLVESLERSFSRHDILRSLRPLWDQLSSSPFISRAQNWPRGYAGDFETIDYILKANNGASGSTAAIQLEAYLLESPICRQHRNKVSRQAGLVSTVASERRHARIISIGCGTSEDLVLNVDNLKASGASVTLMDIDEQALQYSARRLALLSDRLTLIQGNVYRSAARLTGQFDLIMAGGVFDYLDDRVIIGVLSALQSKVADGGVLFFTNVRSGNPYRICMEYMANWHLIHRSETDIKQLIKQADLQGFQCTLDTDDTGLSHLVTLYK